MFLSFSKEKEKVKKGCNCDTEEQKKVAEPENLVLWISRSMLDLDCLLICRLIYSSFNDNR